MTHLILRVTFWEGLFEFAFMIGVIFVVFDLAICLFGKLADIPSRGPVYVDFNDYLKKSKSIHVKFGSNNTIFMVNDRGAYWNNPNKNNSEWNAEAIIPYIISHGYNLVGSDGSYTFVKQEINNNNNNNNN